jgi:zinc protease
MIEFERFTLGNGLKVLLHKDVNTPMACVNTLFDVGARDEAETKTGFAHLFEHLMFGGSINIPEFDTPLQNAGGNNNAFTSNDMTNYYDTLPANNLEVALWLESDRMTSLAFTPKSLEVQRNVVIEEFKQRYLNQPYGDVWLELRPLAYKEHPYKWATIGKEISHVENATMDDVKAFFKKHYHPSNAILCIAGNFERSYIEDMTNKWYGDIPNQLKAPRILNVEPEQNEYRELTIVRAVPSKKFYYSFKMPARKTEGYYTCDLLSDIVGNGKSSRVYTRLKKEQKLVTDISAFVMGSLDEGLLIIAGTLEEHISFQALDEALWILLDEVKVEVVSDLELARVKNKLATAKAFEDLPLTQRALNLCTFELLGDANGINQEMLIYEKIEAIHLKLTAQKIFKKTNCSLLKVQPK